MACATTPEVDLIAWGTSFALRSTSFAGVVGGSDFWLNLGDYTTVLMRTCFTVWRTRASQSGARASLERGIHA
eukprot:3442467-Prymnesium_polylepis.1